MAITSTPPITAMRFRSSTRLALLAALLIASNIEGAELQTARQFALDIYRPYRQGMVSDFAKRSKTILHPHLLALIATDEQVTPVGDIAYLDGDPLCDCQEAEGLKVSRLEITNSAAHAATASATLALPTGTRHVMLKLASTAEGWRIADIGTREEPSLVEALNKDIARRRHAGAH